MSSSSVTVLDAAGVPERKEKSVVKEAADDATAVAAALRQGIRVEVTDQRSATSTVYAEPDGARTTEMTAVPTRFKRGDAWIPLDRTLVPRRDGAVVPRSVGEDVVLSGGGDDAPLIRMAAGDKELALHWPSTLPKPILAGTSATYPEVLQGVDLVMRADAGGYRQLLVVKNADAAKNPALSKVRLRIAAKGVRVTAESSGALKAVDDKGVQFFGSASSMMWDANGRAEKVGVEVSGDVLTLKPDQKFFAGEGTAYPVTVDPAYFAQGHNYWATVLSGDRFRNQAFDRRSADATHPDWAQVGQCWNEHNECNGIGEGRAYFSFYDTGQLAGKDILEAKFYTTVAYSPSCQVRNHHLRPVFHSIGNGTTWNNKPENPGQWIEFAAPTSCNGAHGVELDIRNAVNQSGATTFYLHAMDSNDQFAWRKYASAETRISIKWNRAPNQPANPRTDPPLPTPCKWCAGVPYTANQHIQLITTVSDPDNERVRPKWRVRPTGRPEEASDGDFVPSGVAVSRGLSLTDKDGLQVSWWVHAEDDAPASSAAAHGQLFAVDMVKPHATPTVESRIYTKDNDWHGGTGIPDMFTFGSQGVGDIDHYLYGWQDPPNEKVDATALGGPAQVSIAPPGDGPRTLFVQSVDRAGNKSDPTHHDFNVRAGDGARHQWSFEGNAKDNAYQGDKHGVLNGAASYASGAVGTGLLLDGQPGSAMTAPTTVRTDTSFSVSAWARPDVFRADPMGVVSQDNPQNGYSGWLLHLRDDGQGPKWAFWLPGGTPANPGAGIALETSAAAHQPQQGKWTHVAGVFDRGTAEARLYVDGALAAKKTAPAGWTPWQAGGELAVGRLQWAGVKGHHWQGALDEVQVFDRPLSDAEVGAKVSRDNVRTGHWRFDDRPASPGAPNTKARNEIPGASAGTLINGATFVDNGELGRAVKFDSPDTPKAQVVTDGPAVRTDRSFTVSAWVTANRFVAKPLAMTAVSQDGVFNSGFYLQYNADQHRWVFLKFSADIADGAALRWHGVVAKQTPALGVPVHLTGVYDALTKEMRIYVNGELGNDEKFVYPGTDWDAGGKLVMGRGKFNGAESDFWPGTVDEVRTYSRVLSPDEIKAVVSQNRVSSGSWKFDGDLGDSSGRGLTGTWAGSPAYTDGQSEDPDAADKALRLDGTNAVEAANAVDSTESYTVSAWVRPDVATDCSCTVLSQDHSALSSFALAAGADGKWRMAAASDSAVAGKVQAGAWTHVTGVHNKPRGQIELYVNGTLVATAKHTVPVHNNGKLQVGQMKSGGTPGQRFKGAIDDVQVYSRALFADEIRVMAGRDLALVHNWKLNDSPADSIGARIGALVGGAGYGPGRAGKAARLDGVDDAVTASGVDLRTDRSFTVSAWVNLTKPGPCEDECTRDAVSLSGGADDKGPVKFRLGHRIDQDQASGNGKWIFEMPEANGTVTEAAVSVRPSQFGNWVLLVGVYEASSGQIELYVYNDDPLSEPDLDAGKLLRPWQGAGAVQIGRAVAGPGATASEFWSGGVDDVRLYTGSLSPDRQKALRNSYPAVTSS
ncbi:LamG-like jellyroll fold domain-containing protein [Amycolatopsis sp. WAC 04197]|uniref:LamG-like jellyroll fold domain-containing protein n=1 Tax=Amycolatopsis sp. WAC 04197 TaxID=2203199 RepID=UPI0013153C3E|nr:LamG-like jellyroll fold domain-containing protein [Amycolatopsis sp. WAC 04197]